MTRFNLQEATLLDLSGELGEKAAGHLHAHLKQNSRARAEVDDLIADYALMRSLPKMTLSPADKERLAGEIKQSVRRNVRDLHKGKKAEVRRRYIAGALIGISSLAACLIITLSVVMVQRNQAHKRELAITRAEDSLRDFMNADADNLTDVAIASLSGQINSASALETQWTPVESSGNRAKLLELVDPSADDDILEEGT